MFVSLNDSTVCVPHREDHPVNPRAKWNGKDLWDTFFCLSGHKNIQIVWLLHALMDCLETRYVCVQLKNDNLSSIISRRCSQF